MEHLGILFAVIKEYFFISSHNFLITVILFIFTDKKDNGD